MLKLAMFSLSNKWKWTGRILLIAISFIILFWSLVLSGYQKLKHDIKENSLRKIPIEYIKEMDNGERIKMIYKVPLSNVDPKNLKYPLKIFRDNLWILLGKTAKEKAEIYLLIADKRMFELQKLVKENSDENLVVKTMTNSIYNLTEAKKNLYKDNNKDIEFLILDQKINSSGMAYEDIIKSFNYNNDKTNKILEELEIWNQKNQE